MFKTLNLKSLMEAPPRSKLPFIFEALTCIPRYMHALRVTHAHDPEGIGYHFPSIGQYLNTSSG